MNTEIIQKLDNCVMTVLGDRTIQGFQKAHNVANAIGELKTLLTPEYMKPIMQLMGSRLGFRTDKDKNKDGTPGPGYPEAIVKNCLIEAVLMGLQPTGNQFNIIAGNTYPTKEGLGSLLNTYPGLSYKIICGLPKISNDKTSAAVDVTIEWKLQGHEKMQNVIPIPMKIDSYASVDSIIGKATRKARAWLMSNITGVEITDGEVEDVKFTVVNEKKEKEHHEIERIKLLISDCKTLDELAKLQEENPEVELVLFDKRKDEIISELSK